MRYNVLILLMLWLIAFSCSNKPEDINGYPEDVLEKSVYNKVQSSYDSIGNFEHGTAIVKAQRLYGLLNAEGELILPCDYESVGSYIDSVDVRFVKQNSKWGIIDNKGTFLIKCHYDSYATPCDREYIAFEQNGKWGIVDIKDNIKQQFKFDEIYTYKKYFLAKLHGAWGIETYDNKVLVDYEYDKVRWYTLGEQATSIQKGEKYGVLNKDGKLIAKCEYDSPPFEKNGYVVLDKDKKYGLIDANTGEVIIPFEYQDLDDYSEGLLAAEKNDKYGYINIKNEVVIPFQYADAVRFSEGLAMVGKRTGTAYTYLGPAPVITYGFISKKGDVVIPFKFYHIFGNSICVFNEGLCPYGVYKGRGGNLFANKLGFINKKGEVVIPAQFDDVEEFINGVAAVKIDDKYGVINTKGEFVVPCEYGSIGYYDKNDSIIPLQDEHYKQIAEYNIKKNVIRK